MLKTLNEPIQFCVVRLLRIFLSHGNDSHGSRSKISPLGDIWVCLHLVLPKCNGAACNRASNFWPMIWRLVDRLRSYDSCSGEFTVHLALVQTSNFSRVFNFQEPYFLVFGNFKNENILAIQILHIKIIILNIHLHTYFLR